MGNFKLRLHKDNVVEFDTAGEHLYRGDLVYLHNNGRYYRTTNIDKTKSTTELKIALEELQSGEKGEMLVYGYFEMDSLNLKAGSKYYVSRSLGDYDRMSQISVNDVVRYVGTAFGSTVMLFNPDQTYISDNATKVNEISLKTGEDNVQSDMDEQDPLKDSFVKNKKDYVKIVQGSIVDNTDPYRPVVDETLTELLVPYLSGNTLIIRYKGENGNEQSKNVDLSGINKKDIFVDNADYNSSTYTLTITSNDGTEYNIDLSEFKIEVETNSSGVKTVTQNGETIAIISKVGQTGKYSDLLDRPNLDFDKYLQWKLQIDDEEELDIGSEELLKFVSGENSTITRKGNTITFGSTYENNYTVSGSFNKDTGNLILRRKGIPDLSISFDGRYLTSFTEEDPTVPKWVKEIKESDIEKWNSDKDCFPKTKVISNVSNYTLKESDICKFLVFNSGQRELKPSTDIIATFDTTSMRLTDGQAASDALVKWYNSYLSANPDFEGKLYIVPTNTENYLKHITVIRNGTIRITDTGGWENIGRNVDSLGSISNNIVLLTFVDESVSSTDPQTGYHTGDENSFEYQPTEAYSRDYQNFLTDFNELESFKGVIYPIIRNEQTKALVLQSIAALEARTLSRQEIDSYDTPANISALLKENPYSGSYDPLKDYNWQGVFNKTTPADEVFNSTTFQNEISSLIEGGYEKYSTVRVKIPKGLYKKLNGEILGYAEKGTKVIIVKDEEVNLNISNDLSNSIINNRFIINAVGLDNYRLTYNSLSTTSEQNTPEPVAILEDLPDDFYIATLIESSKLIYRTDTYRYIDLQPHISTTIINTNEIIRVGENNLFVIGNFGEEESIVMTLTNCRIENKELKFDECSYSNVNPKKHGAYYNNQNGYVYLSSRPDDPNTPCVITKINPYNLNDLKTLELPTSGEPRGQTTDIQCYRNNIYVFLTPFGSPTGKGWFIRIDENLSNHETVIEHDEGDLNSVYSSPFLICRDEIIITTFDFNSLNQVKIGFCKYNFKKELINKKEPTLMTEQGTYGLPHWATIVNGKIIVTANHYGDYRQSSINRFDLDTLELEESILVGDDCVITDDNTVDKEGYVYLNQEYTGTVQNAKLLKVYYNDFTDLTIEQDPFNSGKGSYGSLNPILLKETQYYKLSQFKNDIKIKDNFFANPNDPDGYFSSLSNLQNESQGYSEEDLIRKYANVVNTEEKKRYDRIDGAWVLGSTTPIEYKNINVSSSITVNDFQDKADLRITAKGVQVTIPENSKIKELFFYVKKDSNLELIAENNVNIDALNGLIRTEKETAVLLKESENSYVLI